MIHEADKNHDGMISYEEFKDLFDKQFAIWLNNFFYKNYENILSNFFITVN